MADLPGGQTSAVQPTSPATANSSANGGSIRSQSNQVRVNAARVAYSRWKVLFFWAAFGINMLQFVATSVVLGLSYTKPCDSPLFLFLCLYGIMLGSNMFVLVHQYQSPYPEGPEARVASRTENAVKTLSEWTDIVAIALYVAGNIWLSGCRTCPKTAPLLFYTSLAWVIWGYFLLLLPVIGLLCIIMCLPCFIVFFQLFYRGGHAAQHGATPEQISRVRAVSFAPGTTKYDEVDIAEDDAQCAICLSEYQAVEQLRVFPCKHHFHQLCVDQWLRISATCPLCVRPAIAEERV